MSFVVGDKVCTTHGKAKGVIVQIVGECALVSFSETVYKMFHYKEIEPLPKFSVGDRVDLTPYRCIVYGTVIAVYENTAWVKWDENYGDSLHNLSKLVKVVDA